MTPEDFETAIDSLFSRLIEIIDTASEKTIRDIEVACQQAINHTHRVLENHKEWKACRYAICCWVDSEIILKHPNWKDHTLEASYFERTDAHTKFFTEAKRCFEEKRYFNAYEVFFICFMFGFRGVYQPQYRTMIPDGLPKTDAEWQSQAAKRLAEIKRNKKSDWKGTRMIDNQAAPLSGFDSFINNLAIFVLILVGAAMFWILRNSS